MRERVLTLRFDPVLEAFDDGPLREFQKDREAIAVSEHFFVRNHVPYLPILVTYGPDPSVPESPNAGKARSWESGWRSEVATADLPLFNTLREWRAERASREGIAPCLICTNKQLAAIVAAPDGTKSVRGGKGGQWADSGTPSGLRKRRAERSSLRSAGWSGGIRWPARLAGVYVRRGKALIPNGCKARPATVAVAGSSRGDSWR